MAWYCSGSTNNELIENLCREGLIKNERVKKAMMAVSITPSSYIQQNQVPHIPQIFTRNSNPLLFLHHPWLVDLSITLLLPCVSNRGNKVDRGHYAPARPYSDSPQPIGHGATISAPHMHGHACEYLIDYLRPGARVLDIGSGSGYLTHVFASLVVGTSSSGDPKGQVIGVDHIQELVTLAHDNMMKSEEGKKLLETEGVKFVKADGRRGWPEGAPYDAIHVGAAAQELHPLLVEQLRAPGRMFIPVNAEDDQGTLFRAAFGGGQYIWVVDKREDGTIHKEKVFQVSYVPLTDPPK